MFKSAKSASDNPTAQYRLTIIVPLYNELDNIGRLEEELSSYIKRAPVKTGVLFVDDGSIDGSAMAVADVCRRQPQMHYLSLVRNTGLTGALQAGINAIESELVGYIDADLQTNPEDFDLLLPLIDRGADLSMGVRAARKDKPGKRLQSKVANGVRRALTGDKASDTGCPLKIIRSSYARRLPLFNGMHRFMPALVEMLGGKVAEVPVRHYPRTAGTSKYSLRNRWFRPLVDCFGYRWMRSRMVDPQTWHTDLEN